MLHDVGHAPFSHTFETYYDNNGALHDRLIAKAKDEEFTQDMQTVISSAKEHEKMSALLALTVFNDAIKSFGADALLIARMITGCVYQSRFDNEKLFKNCFIRLLNGTFFDVDKLDYLLRDTWASGVNASSIDIERLLSSLCLKRTKNKFQICFNKPALAVIPYLLEASDFQRQWIHAHHKIIYDQYVLGKAVEGLREYLQFEGLSKDFMYSLFDVDFFYDKIKVGDTNFYLTTDDDIVHMIKNNYSNAYAEEWFARKHKLKPLWKNFAEYNYIFKDLPGTKNNYKTIRQYTERTLHELINREKISNCSFFFTDKIEIKYALNIENEIFIAIDGDIISYHLLKMPAKDIEQEPEFFYLYLEKGIIQHKEALLKALRALD